MFGIEKSLGRVMGPMGLLAVGAVAALLTVPGVRKGARRLVVSAIAGTLSLTDEAKKVAEDARSEMDKFASEAKGKLDRLVDEARAYGDQPQVALAAVSAGPADTFAATRDETAARPEPVQKPARRESMKQKSPETSRPGMPRQHLTNHFLKPREPERIAPGRE